MNTVQQILLFGAAFALTATHFYAEPIRWQRAYLSNPGLAWSKTRDLFMSTSLASYLLPFKLGIPLRMALSVRVTGLGVSELGAIMAADAVVTLMAWAGVAALVGGHQMMDLMPRAAPTWALLLLLTGGVTAALSVLLSIKLRRALASFLDALRRLRGKVAVATGVAMVDVLSYGPRHALIALAIGLDPAQWPAWAAMGIVATFAGIVSGMPMGLVGYDATLILLFGAAGAGPAEATLVVVVNRAMSLIAATLLGFPAARRLGLGTSLPTLWKKMKEMANART